MQRLTQTSTLANPFKSLKIGVCRMVWPINSRGTPSSGRNLRRGASSSQSLVTGLLRPIISLSGDLRLLRKKSPPFVKLISQAEFLYFSEGRGGSPNIRPPGWWLALTRGGKCAGYSCDKGSQRTIPPDISAWFAPLEITCPNRTPFSRESRSNPVSTANNRPLIGSRFAPNRPHVDSVT